MTPERDAAPGAAARRPPIVGSLRFRLTALATVVVALVLTITAVALSTVQRRQLLADLDAALEQRADLIAEDFAAAVASTPLNTNDEDRLIQLVADDGTILAATSNLAGAAALPDSLSDSRTQAIETRSDLPLEDDSYRVLSRRIDTAAGPAVLHVAENSDDLDDTVRNLQLALLITIPAVVATLAGLTWWLTGRTLKPVDRMRAQVDAISATNSAQRVDVTGRDDEIRRLGVTMNHMLDRLDEATARQRRFVADAAHELRTPLTRIRTNLEVDLAQPDTADPTATIATVREEAIGLQHLIDDLLHLARSDAGRTAAHLEPVDLDDIVMQEVRDIRSMHPMLRTDTTRVSAAHLDAVADDLRRAVRNLLTNAARHATSAITVDLSEAEGVVELSVADDGPGVPAAHRERIFERFTRVQDARTRDDGGSGLGLAITRAIVEGHGGTIAYTDGPDGGARFVVRIPLRDAER